MCPLVRAKPSVSGFARKRSCDGASEVSPKGGSERYEVRSDDGPIAQLARAHD